MSQNGPKSGPGSLKIGPKRAKMAQKQRKYSENAAKTCDSCGTPDISPLILRLKPENQWNTNPKPWDGSIV